MAKTRNRGFFDEPDEPAMAVDPAAPLADRMRPRSLDEFVGQEHLVGPGRFLRKQFDSASPLPSLIFWGPPGTGKTTLARLLAGRGGATFVAVSAVLSGVKELRESIAEARKKVRMGYAREIPSAPKAGPAGTEAPGPAVVTHQDPALESRDPAIEEAPEAARRGRSRTGGR